MPCAAVATRAALFAAAVSSSLAVYNPGMPESLFALRSEAGHNPNSDDAKTLVASFEGQHNCGITGAAPSKPRSLGFCHKFNDNACCAPMMDDENTEMFDQLTGLGLSCRLRGDIREDPIAKFYCLNCDPDQPRYVRPAAFADVTGEGSPSDGRSATILVCNDFAMDGFGVNPILEGPDGRFQDCGLLKSSPCLDLSEAAIPDRDRYMCGDDLIIPSSYKQADANGTVDVVASLEAFMNADSLGPPVLDEMYGFKLVPNRPCTEDELERGYADATKPLAQQPLCLRTHNQLVVTTYNFVNGATTTTATFRDYFCSDGFGTGTGADGDPGAFTKEDCSQVRALGVAPGSADDKCSSATIRQNFPCCCGSWQAEMCFNGAGGLVPAALTAVLAVAVALMAL